MRPKKKGKVVWVKKKQKQRLRAKFRVGRDSPLFGDGDGDAKAKAETAHELTCGLEGSASASEVEVEVEVDLATHGGAPQAASSLASAMMVLVEIVYQWRRREKSQTSQKWSRPGYQLASSLLIHAPPAFWCNFAQGRRIVVLVVAAQMFGGLV